MSLTGLHRPKWSIFAKKREELSERELAQLAAAQLSIEKMEREAEHMTTLANMPGWELLEDHIDKQVEVWRNQLEKKDDADVRANIKAWRNVKSFVLSKVGK